MWRSDDLSRFLSEERSDETKGGVPFVSLRSLRGRGDCLSRFLSEERSDETKGGV
ncbi:hypothetical protein J3D45_000063 [Microbacterium foliorum]|uniref:hypothetical protein n=1 Tax=Microbacterium foliorum TaxID=104336 RepID=UPI00209EBDAB|nr:hypothetical protein [Microbacterium foliorum]MCP1427565.1 hypothetical protein [Microbacterium foliorum]